jgi:PhzF family phenazine biosynthesis protein
MPDRVRRDLHEANRQSWNVATAAHNRHKLDQAKWLREGGELLFDEDYDLLGPLAGRDVLHLQCNAGQDSLCIARRGAHVTGVDISDEAIGFAQALSRDSGIPASFERADIYDWLPTAAAAGRRFDLVYCSYGWRPWLSDLDTWARAVASVLRPGGAVVLLEFHPYACMFDEQRRLAYPYFGGASGDVLTWAEGVGDYVGASGAALAPSGFIESEQASEYHNAHACHEFVWSVADSLTSLRRAGLTLERFEEWPHTNGCRLFDDMVRVDDSDGRRWTTAPDQPCMPLMLGIRAHKPGGVPMYRVDAFTDQRFRGNPAAVCVLDSPLPDATMLAIAAENNLSETAFLVRSTNSTTPTWSIRWFTPATEVDLCGHATLASAHVVLSYIEPERASVEFSSRSGLLTVTRDPNDPARLCMNFPADPPRPRSTHEPDPTLDHMIAALGATPIELLTATYWLAVFDTEAEVRALTPNFAALAKIPPGEVIVTAPADGDTLDFVSRFFAPGVGIDEDPVTGSAHCILAPYWASRLGKQHLRARQISARGGTIECVIHADQPDRVELIGRCVDYSRGTIEV